MTRVSPENGASKNNIAARGRATENAGVYTLGSRTRHPARSDRGEEVIPEPLSNKKPAKAGFLFFGINSYASAIAKPCCLMAW